MIKTTDLKKLYTVEDVETTALRDIDLEIDDGEYVSIMGPSGCGKSTLLNILGMIDQPTSGEYSFFGEDVSKYSERRRARIRRGTIGVVFQGFNLLEELSVYDNIELPLLYLGQRAAERRERVEEVMEQMGITARRNHVPQQMSGGQQQRVAVARAIAPRPRVILADEPTGNLDSKNGEEVMKILAELNAAGTTLVVVTHSSSYAGYGDRIIHLLDGQIAAGVRQRTSSSSAMAKGFVSSPGPRTGKKERDGKEERL